jgi:hypothetical protein
MLIWGGSSSSFGLRDGALYDPRADTWAPLPPGTDAAGVGSAGRAVWTGREFVVIGGRMGQFRSEFAIGARWAPGSDEWVRLSSSGAVTDRIPTHVVWTGARVLVWYQGGLFTSGPRVLSYDPAGDAWESLSVEGAPTPRNNTSAVWTGQEMVIVGGSVTDRSADRGIRIRGGASAFNPDTNTWRRFAGPQRYRLTAVWADTELLTFGGVGGGGGSRYMPPCT